MIAQPEPIHKVAHRYAVAFFVLFLLLFFRLFDGPLCPALGLSPGIISAVQPYRLAGRTGQSTGQIIAACLLTVDQVPLIHQVDFLSQHRPLFPQGLHIRDERSLWFSDPGQFH